MIQFWQKCPPFRNTVILLGQVISSAPNWSSHHLDSVHKLLTHCRCAMCISGDLFGAWNWPYGHLRHEPRQSLVWLLQFLNVGIEHSSSSGRDPSSIKEGLRLSMPKHYADDPSVSELPC